MSSVETKCRCCNDKGTVADVNGDERPCSRCRAEEFIRWSNERVPASAA